MQDWLKRCKDENSEGSVRIVDYKILNTSVTGDMAFLRVQLYKDGAEYGALKIESARKGHKLDELLTIPGNYQMKRVQRFPFTKWVLYQNAE